jgi:hypothetical protein
VGAVTRDAVADAADHRERRACRVWVVEVAEGDRPLLRDPAELGIARPQFAREVGGQDRRSGDGGERAARHRPAGQHLAAVAAALGRCEPVHDHHRRQLPLELGFRAGGERGGAGEEDGEAVEVVGSAIQLVEQRARERVADDDEQGDALPLDDVPDVGRVEALRPVLEDDGAAVEPGVEAHELAGAVHQRRRGQRAQVGGRDARQLGEVARSGAAEQLRPRVALAPEHAFGATGGPTGVEQVEVVGGRSDFGERLGRRTGEHVLVPARAVEEGVAGAVVDLEERLHRRKLPADGVERRRERRVVDDHRRLTVVQQLQELVGHVPVVDVERDEPGLVGAEHALEVLGTVPEVEGDVVLARRRAVERRTLGVAAQPESVQERSQPPGPLGQLAPGEPSLAGDEALPIRVCGRQRLVRPRQAQLHVARRYERGPSAGESSRRRYRRRP